jgi:hypothetical protein
VFKSAQTAVESGRNLVEGARGNSRVAMNDAQRYRLNAAECIFAGARCEPAYRDLTFALAEAWLSLARQQEAMDELLVIWSEARSEKQAALGEPRQQLRHGPGLPLADAAREV